MTLLNGASVRPIKTIVSISEGDPELNKDSAHMPHKTDQNLRILNSSHSQNSFSRTQSSESIKCSQPLKRGDCVAESLQMKNAYQTYELGKSIAGPKASSRHSQTLVHFCYQTSYAACEFYQHPFCLFDFLVLRLCMP